MTELLIIALIVLIVGLLLFANAMLDPMDQTKRIKRK